MAQDFYILIDKLISSTALHGGLGGIAIFALGYLNEEYKNNKYIAKFSAEIIGASLTAYYFAPLVSTPPTPALAFVVGATWTSILQETRRIVTEKVIDALGRPKKPSNKSNFMSNIYRYLKGIYQIKP